MLQGTVFIFIVGIIFNLSFAKNLQPIETSEINKRDLLGIFENMFQQRSEWLRFWIMANIILPIYYS